MSHREQVLFLAVFTTALTVGYWAVNHQLAVRNERQPAVQESAAATGSEPRDTPARGPDKSTLPAASPGPGPAAVDQTAAQLPLPPRQGDSGPPPPIVPVTEDSPHGAQPAPSRPEQIGYGEGTQPDFDAGSESSAASESLRTEPIAHQPGEQDDPSFDAGLGQAIAELRERGLSEEEIQALLGPASEFPVADGELTTETLSPAAIDPEALPGDPDSPELQP